MTRIDGVLELFNHYKTKPQFADVVFEQFAERLADHLKSATKNLALAKRDQEVYNHDRLLIEPSQNRRSPGTHGTLTPLSRQTAPGKGEESCDTQSNRPGWKPEGPKDQEGTGEN